MSKLEYKYLVPISLLDVLRNEVHPFVEPDPYADKQQDGKYTVRSIYLDTTVNNIRYELTQCPLPFYRQAFS